jgi:ABC-type polysaccharide/polyol phosphate export permease
MDKLTGLFLGNRKLSKKEREKEIFSARMTLLSAFSVFIVAVYFYFISPILFLERSRDPIGIFILFLAFVISISAVVTSGRRFLFSVKRKGKSL